MIFVRAHSCNALLWSIVQHTQPQLKKNIKKTDFKFWSSQFSPQSHVHCWPQNLLRATKDMYYSGS